jgi:ParB family chromosome partitioning protein
MSPSGSESPRRLGRGLEALIGVAAPAAPSPTTARDGEDDARRPGPRNIAITQIRPNPFQPRKDFQPEELAELAASLKASGLLQPILIRPIQRPNGSGGPDREPLYELIAGERRLRAAMHLGWAEIPATVREIDDRAALTLALVENLQRADLNPIEEAEGYAQLIRDFGLTQLQVADVVGKNRSTVANVLRLLELPMSVRALLRDGQLTSGHARALLGLRNERDILAATQRIIAKSLSVREAEEISSRKKRTVSKHKGDSKASKLHNSTTRQIEDRMRKWLQTDVRLVLKARDRGELSILFYSTDDLERILERILGTPSAPHEAL